MEKIYKFDYYINFLKFFKAQNNINSKDKSERDICRWHLPSMWINREIKKNKQK